MTVRPPAYRLWMGWKYRYSDQELAAAVAASFSIAGVMRQLGIRPAGGSHFHISKRIKALGVDTSHFTGQRHNRGKRMPRKPAEEILIEIQTDRTRVKAPMLRRALLELGRQYQCEVCGIESWQDRPIVLHVDHIDGRFENCVAANLRFICPNCHSQTATYCRKLSSRTKPVYAQDSMI